MVIGSIKKENTDYLINLNSDGDKIYYNVTCYSDTVYTLSEEECRKLFDDIFKDYSNLKFLSKEDDYDVYVDEYDNKRYFKDKKEDYYKFFINNGVDALLYENDDFNNNYKSKPDKLLRVLLKSTVVVVALETAFIFSELLSDTSLFDRLEAKYVQKSTEVYENIDLDASDMEKFVLDSSGKNLDDDKKKYLSNNEFFNDVILTSDRSRNYMLRRSLKNMGVEYFEENEDVKKGVLGYYNSLESNVIHLKNNSKEIFDNCAAHEFIHLLQDDNEYNYIREACAEIMASEYYNSEMTSYLEERKRTCVLMEIIGPGPIMDCNFKGDTSTFEDAIGSYLNEEQKNRLLKLFTISSSMKNIEKENIEIDALLSVMYKNKYHSDIKDDAIIQFIYNNGIDSKYNRRIYFNNNDAYYNWTFSLATSKRIPIEEIEKEKYIYECHSDVEISKEEFEKIDAHSLCYKRFECKDDFVIDEEDNMVVFRKTGERYTPEEATKNGYTYFAYYKRIKEVYDTYDDFANKNKEYKFCVVRDKETNKVLGDINFSNSKEIVSTEHLAIPPIPNKFPESTVKYLNENGKHEGRKL